MKNSQKSVWIALLCAAVLSGCISDASDSTTTGSADKTVAVSADLPVKATYSEDDLAAEWSAEDAVKISLNGKDVTVDGSGAEVKNGSVTITKAGTYVFSGKLEDGQIVVDVTKDDKVYLVLNGAEIKKSDNAPIYVKEAKKVILTLQDGTKNTLTDGASYANADASEDEPNAALYSKADLTVNGTGSLVVNGNYKDGLTSRDDLKIVSGTIEVHAVDDGVLGRDLVAVKAGELTVEAGGDGIKTMNDTEESKGNIAVEGGTFDLKAGSDALQAAASVRVDGGSFKIVTGGGSVNGQVHTEERPFGTRPGQPELPGQPAQSGQPAQPGQPAQSGRPAQPDANSGTEATESQTTAESESTSYKGVKATTHIAVTGGTFAIDSADDAVHSNGAITMSGGEMKISSGDDGIHADASVTIEGGTVVIAKSYEGIESKLITIAGGDLRVVASDDGVNVGGGNDGSSTNGRPGQNTFASAGDSKLVIKGGNLKVDAKGDGLDSNSAIEMSGGIVMVNGPTENMNGALDYDGNFLISGGTLAAAGRSGMAQAPSDDSSQKTILMSFSATQTAGTKVRLQDADGKTIASVTPTTAFQTLVISSPELKEGATYTLYSGESKMVEFSVSKSVTWLNESGVTEAVSGHNGMGGGRGMPPQRPATGQ